jgi:hypothetical protein
MIRSLTEKLKNMEDITPEEAGNFYEEIIPRLMTRNNDPELTDLFNAAILALHEGLRGNFITALPIDFRRECYQNHKIKIRSYLQPTERISDVILFNIDKHLFKGVGENGLQIKEGRDFCASDMDLLNIDCNRYSLVKQKFSKIFDMKFINVGQGEAYSYICDIFRYGFSVDSTPVNTMKKSDNFIDMKAEFLRLSGIPVMLVWEDCLYDNPDNESLDNKNHYIVYTKDCRISRYIASLDQKDLNKMIKANKKMSKKYKQAVRSDIPNIIKDCLAEVSLNDEQIGYER